MSFTRRRTPFTAAFIPVVVFGQSADNILVLMTVFRFIYGMPYSIAGAYMGESFETKVRGSAVGTTYSIGRIGAVLSPIAIGFFATTGTSGAGLLAMSAAYLLCGVICAVFIRRRVSAGPLSS